MPSPFSGTHSASTLLVNRDAKLCAFGDNSRGQLGLGESAEQKVHRPQIVKGFPFPTKNIAMISCGKSHSAILDRNGTVWCAGAYMKGSSSCQFIQVEIAKSLRIVAISTGYFVTYALDDSGALWAWGTRNQCGQLGRKGEPGTSPEQVKFDSPVPKIRLLACGGDFTVVADEAGSVYMWGDNSYGPYTNDPDYRGALAKDLRILYAPTKLDIQGISAGLLRDLGAGTHFIALVDSHGKAFAGGLNDRRQCGREKRDPWYLAAVPGVPELQSISCGAQHVVAKTVDGELWGWGKNKFLQLGKKVESYTLPIHLDHFPATDGFSACLRNTWVMDNEGKMWVYGMDSHGQGGMQEREMDGLLHDVQVSRYMVDPELQDEESSSSVSSGFSESESVGDDIPSDDLEDHLSSSDAQERTVKEEEGEDRLNPSAQGEADRISREEEERQAKEEADRIAREGEDRLNTSDDALIQHEQAPQPPKIVDIKVTYCSEIRRGHCSSDLNSIREEVSFLFSLHAENILLHYTDDIGDKIDLTSESLYRILCSTNRSPLSLNCVLLYAGRTLGASVTPNPCTPGQKATLRAQFTKSANQVDWPEDTQLALFRKSIPIENEQTIERSGENVTFYVTFQIPEKEKERDIKYFFELSSVSESCTITHTQNTISVPISPWQ